MVKKQLTRRVFTFVKKCFATPVDAEGSLIRHIMQAQVAFERTVSFIDKMKESEEDTKTFEKLFGFCQMQFWRTFWGKLHESPDLKAEQIWDMLRSSRIVRAVTETIRMDDLTVPGTSSTAAARRSTRTKTGVTPTLHGAGDAQNIIDLTAPGTTSSAVAVRRSTRNNRGVAHASHGTGEDAQNKAASREGCDKKRKSVTANGAECKGDKESEQDKKPSATKQKTEKTKARIPPVEVTDGTNEEENEMRKWLDEHKLPQSVGDAIGVLGARCVGDIRMIIQEYPALLSGLADLDREKLKKAVNTEEKVKTEVPEVKEESESTDEDM
jgi:hypothetical protein